jgi:hypothetical protein
MTRGRRTVKNLDTTQADVKLYTKAGCATTAAGLKISPSEFLSFEHFDRGKHQKTVVLKANGDILRFTITATTGRRVVGKCPITAKAVFRESERLAKITDSFSPPAKRFCGHEKERQKDPARAGGQLHWQRGGHVNYLNAHLEYPRQPC